ncbi:13E12 repeat family protein [Mycobacterium sp. SVM_VP21]|nr:13E12 repeat family protein [Mycobacterium sp. SVM_VP21]
MGTECRPDELAKLAQRLADHLHPDGNYTEDDRAKRRGVILGPQGSDGMTPIKGYLDPQVVVFVCCCFCHAFGAPCWGCGVFLMSVFD